MKKTKNQKKKEDHLAPTEIHQDKKTEKDYGQKNLSHGQLLKVLDNYSMGGQEQFFTIQKIKLRYLKETDKKNANRTTRAGHYSHGKRTALPHSSHETLQYDLEQIDQKRRDEIAKEAKSHYREHNSLFRYFNRQKDKGKLSKAFRQQDKETFTSVFNKQDDRGKNIKAFTKKSVLEKGQLTKAFNGPDHKHRNSRLFRAEREKGWLSANFNEKRQKQNDRDRKSPENVQRYERIGRLMDKYVNARNSLRKSIELTRQAKVKLTPSSVQKLENQSMKTKAVLDSRSPNGKWTKYLSKHQPSKSEVKREFGRVRDTRLRKDFERAKGS